MRECEAAKNEQNGSSHQTSSNSETAFGADNVHFSSKASPLLGKHTTIYRKFCFVAASGASRYDNRFAALSKRNCCLYMFIFYWNLLDIAYDIAQVLARWRLCMAFAWFVHLVPSRWLRNMMVVETTMMVCNGPNRSLPACKSPCFKLPLCKQPDFCK